MKPEDGGASYDQFRGRVMFPIMDAKGRSSPSAAGPGRRQAEIPQLAGDAALPRAACSTTSTSRKSLRATNRKSVVAEGYMDVIALRVRFRRPWHPLGTALTGDQIQLLWRLAPNRSRRRRCRQSRHWRNRSIPASRPFLLRLRPGRRGPGQPGPRARPEAPHRCWMRPSRWSTSSGHRSIAGRPLIPGTPQRLPEGFVGGVGPDRISRSGRRSPEIQNRFDAMFRQPAGRSVRHPGRRTKSGQWGQAGENQSPAATLVLPTDAAKLSCRDARMGVPKRSWRPSLTIPTLHRFRTGSGGSASCDRCA